MLDSSYANKTGACNIQTCIHTDTDKATLRVIGAREGMLASNHSWGRPCPITAGGARVQSQAGREEK
jgi:hypothetical protein